MSIVELTKKVKASASKRTTTERIKLLQSARILDNSGDLDPAFFTTTPAVRRKPASTMFKPFIAKRSSASGKLTALVDKSLKASKK